MVKRKRIDGRLNIMIFGLFVLIAFSANIESVFFERSGYQKAERGSLSLSMIWALPIPAALATRSSRTPNIDKLASEGIKLTNFYVNSPICSASRVALTTGQYQGRWKIHSFLNTRAGNANRDMANYLAASAPTTAKKLKAAGYATAHFGKWHMGGGRDVDDAPLPVAYGFGRVGWFPLRG